MIRYYPRETLHKKKMCCPCCPCCSCCTTVSAIISGVLGLAVGIIIGVAFDAPISDAIKKIVE